MQETAGLVSIIIPVFKTGKLISETVESVLNQTYDTFELLVIDDGSNDSTIAFVEQFRDSRIKTFVQENQGMAQTRNNGLKRARGEYVAFLDHDDILTEEFLESRVDYLTKNLEAGFVGGPIRTFPENPRDYLAVARDVEGEMLFFDPRYLTTPSSYLIRRKVLDNNKIRFNTNLSSTADRFLLMQLSKVTVGGLVDDGLLLYRVSSQGFSQRVTNALMRDNEQFYFELKSHNLLPTKAVSKFRCLYFFMLAGGFKQIFVVHKMAWYVLRSFLANPVSFWGRVWESVDLRKRNLDA